MQLENTRQELLQNNQQLDRQIQQLQTSLEDLSAQSEVQIKTTNALKQKIEEQTKRKCVREDSFISHC